MKESVRIFRFIVIGTMNALIMALVVWLMMREMSFEGDYMVANVTAYVIAQIQFYLVQVLDISCRKEEEQCMETNIVFLFCLRCSLHCAVFIPCFVGRRVGCQ